VNKKQKRCLWIAAGVATLAVIVVVTVVAGFGWFVYQNFSLQTTKSTQAAADAEFDRIRARFVGQQPLIRIDEHGEAHVVPRQRPSGSHDLQWVHVVIYDPKSGESSTMRIPFWLVRLAPGDGHVSIGENHRTGSVHVKVTVKEIDAAGPGLLLDHDEPNGTRTIAWTE
jgi:hypothetical protein